MFDPAPGTATVKTIQCDVLLELEQLEFSIRNEEGEFSASSCGTESTCSRQSQLVLRDEYVRIGDNRPELLQRRFDRMGLRSEREVDGVSSGEESSSPLLGKQVSVEWDPQSEEYVTAYGPEDRYQDESLLEGLPHDFDLYGLLPGRSIEVGDWWFVDATALRGLLSIDELMLEATAGDGLPDLGLGDCNGELRVEFAEQFDRGKTRIGRMRLQGDLDREVLFETIDPDFHIGLGYTTESWVHRTIRCSHEIEGSVDWNLDENRWDQFELRIELGLDATETGTWGDQEIRHRTIWSGSAKLEGVSEGLSADPDAGSSQLKKGEAFLGSD